jgi:hypothetical protein
MTPTQIPVQTPSGETNIEIIKALADLKDTDILIIKAEHQAVIYDLEHAFRHLAEIGKIPNNLSIITVWKDNLFTIDKLSDEDLARHGLMRIPDENI